MLGESNPAALRGGLAQQQRCTRWRIHFHAVVHLDDLHIVIGQSLGGLTHQLIVKRFMGDIHHQEIHL